MPAAARPSRSALAAWCVPPAVAVGLSALFVGQAVLRARVLHLPLDLASLLIQSGTRWLLYVPLVPVVGACVARLPIERGHRSRWPTHLALVALLSAAHVVGMAGIYRLFHVYPRQDSIGDAIVRLGFTFFASDFVIFAAVSGIHHAIRSHREAVRRGEVAAALTARLANARLEALRGQLRPHFLFNALHAVGSLVLAGEREAVITMLSRLGDVLRISLDRSLPQEVTAGRELELLQPYLDVQKTRFGDRLTVVIELAGEARDALVPSLVLLPLVENALRHGIEARPGPGLVRIAIRPDAGSLRIRVEDSGPGFSAGSAVPGLGIGLENTRARLAHLHGGRQSVACGDLPGIGAFVEIVLPLGVRAQAVQPEDGAGELRSA